MKQMISETFKIKNMDVEISELLGKTFSNVQRENDEEIIFLMSDGTKYKMYHQQDCCECVRIEDVEGDLEDLIGSPILQAEESTNNDAPRPEYAESYTWTFYKLATVKGYVTIRWLGESNGYYSEGVDLIKIEPNKNF